MVDMIGIGWGREKEMREGIKTYHLRKPLFKERENQLVAKN